MIDTEAFLRPLASVRHEDAATVGAKAADLGELTATGLRVPAGFVVDDAAYRHAMDLAGVAQELSDLWSGIDGTTTPDAVERVAARMQELVCKAGMPADVRARVARAYTGVGIRPSARPMAVAVRTSAVGGRPGDAFPGVHLTRTNVHGHDALSEAIVECWASAVSFRALTYRVCRGLEAEPAVAVLVQDMVPAQKAGVALTADPVGGIADRIVVEAALGQGSVVADGTVEPDTYVYRRPWLELVSVHVGNQTHQVVRGRDGDDLTTTLDPYRAAVQVLGEREAGAVADAARRAQVRLGSPRAVEWATVLGQVWILQAGPALSRTTPVRNEHRLRGRGASAGRVTGAVRILRRPGDVSTVVAGEVVVTEGGGPEWSPALRYAAAVIVDRGGITCRTAVLARELGVPCVVAAGEASSELRDGDVVTVDGLTGDLTPEDGGPGSWGRGRPARVVRPLR